MSISKIVAFGAQKIQTSSLRSRSTHNERLFGADFGTVASLGHFSSKMSKEPPLWSMASVTFFENRIISRNSDINWPPRNCDLTLLDYFLWRTV